MAPEPDLHLMEEQCAVPEEDVMDDPDLMVRLWGYAMPGEPVSLWLRGGSRYSMPISELARLIHREEECH